MTLDSKSWGNNSQTHQGSKYYIHTTILWQHLKIHAYIKNISNNKSCSYSILYGSVKNVTKIF